MEKNGIDMTGRWFVHFGFLDKVEGSRVVTLNGEFNADDLLDEITKSIYATLDDGIRRALDEMGAVLVIRNLNRIG